jgi:LmbE family N-acetylglucosaminyl deacetylase
MSELLRNKKIMIVVAHPDDELLGLGATMHKLIKEYNAKTHVVILGEGITSRSDTRDTDKWKHELEVHRSNIKSAQSFIGYHSLNTYDFPDNRFDSVALLDIVKAVEKEKSNFKPEIIFTHFQGDLNIDHQRTFEAVITASRPLAEETVKTIISFETPSATEWNASTIQAPFNPNFFIEISEHDLEAKINGMQSYQYEKRPYPHPRSPEALKILAQHWGIVTGCKLAEAFSIVRSIQN